VCVAGNAQATMNINIKPQPGEFPSSEEIDKPMNQQDPGEFHTSVVSRHYLAKPKHVETRNVSPFRFGTSVLFRFVPFSRTKR